LVICQVKCNLSEYDFVTCKHKNRITTSGIISLISNAYIPKFISKKFFDFIKKVNRSLILLFFDLES
ncbi:hypothetical protein KJN74_03420, partial [Candidatus Bathyarchaeota archaeon]|nr:hypothetical protein [Candidatus Bathyarchaeota archaeon]